MFVRSYDAGDNNAINYNKIFKLKKLSLNTH